MVDDSIRTRMSRTMNSFSFLQGFFSKLSALFHVTHVAISDAQVGECDGHRDVVRTVNALVYF